MDPVTHTLVGVGIANAFFRKRTGAAAVPILAVASNLPDIDAAVLLTGEPAAILMRRTFGHSLFTLPFWTLALALLFRRRYRQIPLPTLYGLVALGAAVHLFFDLINSFGVVLLWPLSDWRPELAIVFIIDLFLTGVLAAPLLLALLPNLRPRLEALSRLSVVCIALYLAFCGVNRMLAQRMLAEVPVISRPADFTYPFPEPFGPHRWKGVVREGEIYRVYLLTPLAGRIEMKEKLQTKEHSPEVKRAQDSPLGRRLNRFFKAPVWEAEEGKNLGEGLKMVQVYDLRFTTLLAARPNP
ncbi:MAG TPA: metal-dependent hydrolase, partial [Candidatus Manganitrophaceae bacterium]|nr:metal-dependent hydrolase [Candidatus Manganitrophaceae bacterium]